MKATVKQHKVHGGTRWVVGRFVNGKRVRTFYATQQEAEAEAARIRVSMADTEEEWRQLTKADRDRIMAAWQEAQRRNVDLLKATMVADPREVPGDGPALGKVIDWLVNDKRQANRSPEYVDNLDLILGQFRRGREMTPFGLITVKDVSDYLASKKLASRSTLRSRLSTLFEYGIRHGYRSDNPCGKLEHITIPSTPPPIFTNAQVATCIQWLKANWPEGVWWFILTTACGLRPEEATRIKKKDVNINEGWVRVETGKTSRRVVYPRPEALVALKRHPGKPISKSTMKRIERELREVLKWEAWPKDITRHTAASNWLAVVRSAGEVAESLGNSERVLKRHYKALVTKADALEFWAIIAQS